MTWVLEMKKRTKIFCLSTQKNGRQVFLNPGANARVGSYLPCKTKKQDHYAVLGLSHLRFKATKEQIKIARM